MSKSIVYELSENEIGEALELAVHAYSSDQDFHKAFSFRKPLSLTYIRSIHHLKLLSFFATKPYPLGIRIDDKLVGFVLYRDTKPLSKINPEQAKKYSKTRLEYDVLNKGTYSPTMWLYSIVAMRAFPKVPYYFIDMLAISPIEWGKGHAKILISKIIERSLNDPVSTGVGITTYSLSKAQIYRDMGFEMLRHIRIFGVNICSIFLSHPHKQIIN